jgi:hypothetical protein
MTRFLAIVRGEVSAGKIKINGFIDFFELKKINGSLSWLPYRARNIFHLTKTAMILKVLEKSGLNPVSNKIIKNQYFLIYGRRTYSAWACFIGLIAPSSTLAQSKLGPRRRREALRSRGRVDPIALKAALTAYNASLLQALLQASSSFASFGRQ